METYSYSWWFVMAGLAWYWAASVRWQHRADACGCWKRVSK